MIQLYGCICSIWSLLNALEWFKQKKTKQKKNKTKQNKTKQKKNKKQKTKQNKKRAIYGVY